MTSEQLDVQMDHMFGRLVADLGGDVSTEHVLAVGPATSSDCSVTRRSTTSSLCSSTASRGSSSSQPAAPTSTSRLRCSRGAWRARRRPRVTTG
jgi:hypothetical protein